MAGLCPRIWLCTHSAPRAILQVRDFTDKVNFYVMNAVTFFKSMWPDMKCNAALFVGKLVGCLPVGDLSTCWFLVFVIGVLVHAFCLWFKSLLIWFESLFIPFVCDWNACLFVIREFVCSFDSSAYLFVIWTLVCSFRLWFKSLFVPLIWVLVWSLCLWFVCVPVCWQAVCSVFLCAGHSTDTSCL